MNDNERYAPGLADEEFLRAPGVPMTKNEIRILVLAKLRLFPGAVVYDVGAGTGSVAIEAKLLCPSSRVYAVEREPQALQLLAANSDRLGASLEVIAGSAPEAMAELPFADRIFIGGSGGNLAGIIATSDQKLRDQGWMVINSISLKNTAQAFEDLETRGYQVEAVQVSIAVSSNRGSATIWLARNPVTIISGQKGGAKDGLR